MTRCPECCGLKRKTVIADPGCRLMVIDCEYCGASGVITPERLAARERGDAHRHARVARDESLLECAKRYGARPSELSAFERGLREPDESWLNTCPPQAPAAERSDG